MTTTISVEAHTDAMARMYHTGYSVGRKAGLAEGYNRGMAARVPELYTPQPDSESADSGTTTEALPSRKLPASWADQCDADPPPKPSRQRAAAAALRQHTKKEGAKQLSMPGWIRAHHVPHHNTQYDNSAVHSHAHDAALGIHELGAITTDAMEGVPAQVAALDGLALYPVATGVRVFANLQLASGKWLELCSNRVNLMWSVEEDAPVPVLYKSTMQWAQDRWRKDLVRRTYLQEAQLHMMMVEAQTGERPPYAVVVGMPTELGSGSAWRYRVDNNSQVLLGDINKHTDKFRRFDGSKSPPCQESELKF